MSDRQFDYLKKQLQIESRNPDLYSPLGLAYIGDAVFDLMVRTIEVNRSNRQVNKYHKEVSAIVCAPMQAKIMEELKPFLNDEERAIYKRGRNAHSYTKAKNATHAQYRKATGFEAVLGYLYMKEDFERLTDVVARSLQIAGFLDEE